MSRVKAASGVAIFDRTGRLLLGRHAHDGRWATIGGGVNPGESLVDAARREVGEEVHLDLSHLSYLGDYRDSPIYDVEYQDGSIERYAVTMFVTVIDDQLTDPRPDLEEIIELIWVNRKDTQTLELAPDMEEIVPAAFAWYKEQVTHATV